MGWSTPGKKMKHIFRFLGRCEDHNVEVQKWMVEGDELVHLKKVLKLTIGCELEVFDGLGHAAFGRIVNISKDTARIEALRLPLKKNTLNRCAIAIGLLKPGFIEEVLPSITELGISDLHIFLQDKQGLKRITNKVISRWERILLSSSKQCKRDYVPKILFWKSLEDMLSSFTNTYQSTVYLHPNTSEYFLSHLNADDFANTTVCAIVGSEKGFTEEETKKMDSVGCRPQQLGPYTLRSFTSSIVVATLLADRHRQLENS